VRGILAETKIDGFNRYDTQQIIERFRSGDRDYMQGAIDIFFDLITIFKYALLFFGIGGNND
jgi:FtsH-binding integral membrane protein